MSTSTRKSWRHLERRTGSAYQQLFIKGTRLKARDLYGMYMSEEDPQTPEEIAKAFKAYHVSVEAVREAIAYCESNPPEIRQDFLDEEALLQCDGKNDARRPNQTPSKARLRRRRT